MNNNDHLARAEWNMYWARFHKRAVKFTSCPASKFYEEDMVRVHVRQARECVRLYRENR